ncbi:hypothetical protein Q4E93_15480 [Flavitalea sp. BT771]|uniref:DUF6770 family protein n=1 Tax=Flavitalea sp. BT771 TaxID=3063329 RepID=UPI0026E427C6|nr:DUF6770 family protein [Flavitalea sp. BT771]MDO6432002.1 hypothetical protein [Flavitalea sp. BT771]MDV6220911.1 DUF6770 family protein [Flavitalea sp. BT771]
MSHTKKLFFLLLLAAASGLMSEAAFAQSKLSIDKVYSAYLRNSGTISSQGQIKGYFFLYQSDKIDKHTNEYTLQILDENLNKVRSIKFEDTKKLNLLESSYNGNSISFLFKNEDEKTLDMKIYDMDGKLKNTYSRGYDKKTDALMKQYETMHTDEGMNKNVFDIGNQGYVSVLPMRDGKQRTYEVDYYSSEYKKQWTYVPSDDAEKYAFAEYLGATDSLIILEVLKKNHALSGNVTTHLVGINFVTKKKQFDIDYAADNYKLMPTYVAPLEGTANVLVIGPYYDKDDNVGKDFSKGLAIYEMTTAGKFVNKTYNSWTEDFSKYLATNRKGKIDDVGFLYIHKVIRTPDHKMFIVGEGYKRQASAGGIALSVLAGGNMGVTKIVVTDMVMMEFDGKYKVKGATIYDKTNNTAIAGVASDYNSQHTLAIYLKMIGAFDYDFTTGEADNSNFAVCYSDYERSSDYKGQTFNAIKYNGSKFTTDKIPLKSKASTLKVFPAKAGSVMILEYFKKDKRLDFRLEKLG